MNKNLSKIPLEHRFIEFVMPGFFFAETSSGKWAKKCWENIEELVEDVKKSRDGDIDDVGFKRFIYDPSVGKKYIDEGWVYFRGRKFSSKDLLSGKAEKECSSLKFVMTDIAKSNIKNNGWKHCLFLEKYSKLWPLNDEDVVVEEET